MTNKADNQSYIFHVVNRGAEIKSNVIALGANFSLDYPYYSFNEDGSLINGDIMIVSGVADIGYKDLLEYCIKRPAAISKTWVASNYNLFLRSLTIEFNEEDMTVGRPFQFRDFEQDRGFIDYEFWLSGRSSIKIANLFPSEILTISLLPK